MKLISRVPCAGKQSNVILLAFCLIIFSSSLSLQSQNVKSDKVEYIYIRLPLNPLSLPVKNYQSFVFATYEEKNAEKIAAYEAEKKKAEDEYQAEMAAYPALVQEAKDKYAYELDEWNKKSLGEKVVEKQILNENNKPVEHIPSEPRLRSVAEPKLQTSYDYPTIADTWLHLYGYEKKPEQAVQIQVTIFGYDYTQPRQISVTKNETSIVNGQTSTHAVTYYHIEFSYRHPMSFTVTAPDGNILMNLTPQELNTYKIYKSPENEKPADINSELLVKTYEEQIFQRNLFFIDSLINDKYGNTPTSKIAELFYVKEKDEVYKDLLIAFNDATSGLKLMVDNKEAGTTKMNNAISLWQTALKESDPQNKKARIDKEITIAICFNLLECYFALGETAEAEKIITLMNGLSLSTGDRKQKEKSEADLNDLKKRQLANQ